MARRGVTKVPGPQLAPRSKLQGIRRSLGSFTVAPRIGPAPASTRNYGKPAFGPPPTGPSPYMASGGFGQTGQTGET